MFWSGDMRDHDGLSSTRFALGVTVELNIEASAARNADSVDAWRRCFDDSPVPPPITIRLLGILGLSKSPVPGRHEGSTAIFLAGVGVG